MARDLTPKQRAFVEAYLKHTDASYAAVDNDITLDLVAPQVGYYVYLLLDGNAQRILYIGKGKRQRMFKHVRDAESGKISGLKKYKLLVDELRAGRRPIPVVFEYDLSEDDALVLERTLIAAIGTQALGNTSAGGTHPARIRVEQLNDIWARLKPLPEWYWEMFTQHGIEYAQKYEPVYHKMVSELIGLMHDALFELNEGARP